MAGIEQMEQELAAVEATLAEELKIYNQIKAVNRAEMVIRQNDLDVFTFTHAGTKALHFDDKQLQHKYERLLTAKSKKMISDVLGVVQAGGRPLSLLQVDQPMNTTTAVPPPDDDTPSRQRCRWPRLRELRRSFSMQEILPTNTA